jgi:hypothetical protein
MLLNMEKMKVDKERLRDENFAMKKLNSTLTEDLAKANSNNDREDAEKAQKLA